MSEQAQFISMFPELIIRLVAGIVLLAGNAFFVGTEFALTRVRQFPKEEFDSHPGLRRAWAMTDELEIYLSGCQVGITISSVLLGVVAEPAVSTVFSGLFQWIGLTSAGAHSTVSIIVALVAINLLHVVFGEQVPTYLGVERTKLVAKYLAPLLYAWVVILGPVIRLADKVSKSILSVFGVEITRSWTEEDTEDTEQGPVTMADTRREIGAILSGAPLSEERKTEIMNALDISDIPVEQIMVSTEDIRSLSTDANLDETLTYIQERPHTRYPLMGENGEQFVGTIYTATVLQHLSELQSGEETVQNIASELMVVPPHLPVSALIDRFQEEQQELALISKSDSTPLSSNEALGIVTTTDAFESITGELEDPIDSDASNSH